VVRIDVELAKRKMSVGEFSERVGLTSANVAVLKNGRAKAVRFSILDAMCRVLDCQPADVLEVGRGNEALRRTVPKPLNGDPIKHLVPVCHRDRRRRRGGREADDSPGLQLLGVLLFIGAVVLGVRMVQRSGRTHRAELSSLRRVRVGVGPIGLDRALVGSCTTSVSVSIIATAS
jgi:putative transcriptional regulator